MGSYLSRRWLGEPKSPLVHQRMLDVEIVLVVKDGNLIILSGWLLVLVAAADWGNGDRRQIDLTAGFSFSSHVCGLEVGVGAGVR